MFTRVQDFLNEWKTETGFTKAILKALTDQSLAQAINTDHRTIGRIAWHIVTTIPEMMSNTGLKLDFDEKAPVPPTAAEILAGYEKCADALAEQVKSNWDDNAMMTEDNLYGEQWARGKTLLILIKHEIHHRGQLTVLMRQAGVVVPSMYGPAKEGWAAYGAEPPVI